ncbi:hypothetical protein [Streptomyces sp. NPDC059893]|uniref:hypothetical protein n=1 Tax=Streptomyces sp. NPDC059893 TaxID=3346990 RepID=UPI003669C4B9
MAKDLGLNHETLRLWIKAAETAEAPSARAEADKVSEIAALRRQVRELELELLRGLRCSTTRITRLVQCASPSAWPAQTELVLWSPVANCDASPCQNRMTTPVAAPGWARSY